MQSETLVTRAKTQSTPSSEKKENTFLCALASWRDEFSCSGFV
jgi:hypothetical protein